MGTKPKMSLGEIPGVEMNNAGEHILFPGPPHRPFPTPRSAEDIIGRLLAEKTTPQETIDKVAEYLHDHADEPDNLLAAMNGKVSVRSHRSHTVNWEKEILLRSKNVEPDQNGIIIHDTFGFPGEEPIVGFYSNTLKNPKNVWFAQANGKSSSSWHCTCFSDQQGLGYFTPMIVHLLFASWPEELSSHKDVIKGIVCAVMDNGWVNQFCGSNARHLIREDNLLVSNFLTEANNFLVRNPEHFLFDENMEAVRKQQFLLNTTI